MTCTTVSMDIYWNAIATPLLIFVVVNGILALFRMTGMQRATSLSVMGTLASLKAGAPTRVSPAKAAAPAKAGNALLTPSFAVSPNANNNAPKK